MARVESHVKQLQDRINNLTLSEESLRVTLAAMAREIQLLQTRISQLESDLLQLTTSTPITDGEVGRSTDTTAGGYEQPD